MMCENPYTNDGMAYGCGQCMPCRVNNRRVWLHRIMLEAGLYKDNAFVTLTYSDEHLPRSYEKQYVDKETSPALATLQPKDLQDWLKRIRKEFASSFQRRLRFFAVGEYGDDTHRPHYHVMLFNYPPCANFVQYGGTRYKRDGSFNCCASCKLIADTWPYGRVHVGSCSMESASYIAGYVTKKMTSKDDVRLRGRVPEFARMSLKPGLGADMMDEVASTLMSFNLESGSADVPSALQHGNRKLPLGRYLRRRLRERVGRDPSAPASVLNEIQAELQPLREAAWNSSTPFKEEVIKAGQGKRANLAARQRIWKKKGSL